MKAWMVLCTYIVSYRIVSYGMNVNGVRTTYKSSASHIFLMEEKKNWDKDGINKGVISETIALIWF